jgi:hypothetical protein
MKVRYTVTLDDLVALNLYLNKKSGAGRGAYLVTWLGLPIICALGAVQVLQLDHIPFAFFLGILALFWLLVFPFRYRAALARGVRAFVTNLGGRGIIGERSLIFSEELLVALSETVRTEVRWENMTSVDVVGEYTYIFLTGITALVLPRHGFDSDAEYEAARAYALRKLDGRVAP